MNEDATRRMRAFEKWLNAYQSSQAAVSPTQRMNDAALEAAFSAGWFAQYKMRYGSE